MTAVRLARGATGRDRVVLFSGCYHGHSDGLLAGRRQRGRHPGPAGVGRRAPGLGGRDAGGTLQPSCPRSARDVAARDRGAGRRQHGPGPPGPGFLEGLREACTRAGALLIFDEVITGFRVGPGGASRLFGVTPGPVVLRQGDRRGPAAGRLRGPARRDGAAGAPRARLPGRDPVGEPGGDGRRAWPCSRSWTTSAYKELAAWAGRLGAGLAGAAQDAGPGPAGPGGRAAGGRLLRARRP